MSAEPRKRSRFGDEPSEPPRKSKFDRRSRSPASRDNDSSKRSRSPVGASNDEEAKAKSDAIAKAAAAAARINAMLSKKKAESPGGNVTPVRLTTLSATPGNDSNGGSSIGKDIYTQDGDYIKDIEINDLKNRYTMTKGQTQKMIKDQTGADVTTRGSYYPDKEMATPAAPPLYLHVTSTTKEGLEQAVAKIEELIAQDLPDLVDQRRFRGRREPEQPDPDLDSRGRRKWPEERIPVNLEPIPGFNLRASVVGTGGANVKHIQQESGCRIQIKGRGSGYFDGDTGRESEEDMYLHVAGPDPKQVERAKELCESLLAAVRDQYDKFKENRARGGGPGNHNNYGDRRGGNDGYQGGRDQQGSGNGSAYGGHNSYGGAANGSHNTYGGAANPYANGAYGDANAYSGYGAAQPAESAEGLQDDAVANAAIGMDAAQYQAWAQYYQQNPSEDPYAAYGGFSVYMSMYQQWAASGGTMAFTAGSPSQATGPGVPPGPPGQGSPPPPPPPPPA